MDYLERVGLLIDGVSGVFNRAGRGFSRFAGVGRERELLEAWGEGASAVPFLAASRVAQVFVSTAAVCAGAEFAAGAVVSATMPELAPAADVAGGLLVAASLLFLRKAVYLSPAEELVLRADEAPEKIAERVRGYNARGKIDRMLMLPARPALPEAVVRAYSMR